MGKNGRQHDKDKTNGLKAKFPSPKVSYYRGNKADKNKGSKPQGVKGRVGKKLAAAGQ